MSDLISRNRAISILEQLEEHSLSGKMDISNAIYLLENQPTTYSVDKVVEQLEEVGQKMSESKSMQKYGKSSPANHRYYKAVSVKQAIGIVKGGGVDEYKKSRQNKEI